MEVTKRDVVIITVFLIVLSAGTVIAIRALRPPVGDNDDRMTATSRPRAAEDGGPPAGVVDAESPEAVRLASRDGELLSSSLPAGRVLAGFEVIGERKLFEPLIRVQSGGRTDTTPTPEVPDVDAGNQAPAPSGGGRGIFDTAGQPVSGDDGGPQQPDVQASGVAGKPPVAVTGFIRTDGGYRVVIEETSTRRVRIVSVGEEAFGYRVRQVSEDQRRVTLENTAGMAGEPVTVTLGENKQVAAAPQESQGQGQGEQQNPQQGGSGNGSSGMQTYGGGMRGFGGFDPSQLTPEQRARYEEYMRRRGGDGQGGGGFRGRGR